MADSTDNKPNFSNTTETDKVEGSNNSRRLAQKPSLFSKLPLPSERKLLRVLQVCIVLLLIAVAGVLVTNYHGNTVFSINGKNYSKAEVKKLTAYQTEKQHVSFNTAAHNVYNQLFYQTAAKNAGISVTPAEETNYVTNELQPASSTYNKYKAWFNVLAYNGVVKSKLTAVDNNREGYTYVFWFGDAVQPIFRPSERSPKYGNQQAYKADQQYASQKANYYHSQLQANKMTPDQVLSAVKNDPNLAPQGLVASNPSTHFGTPSANPRQTWQVQISNNAISDYVKTAAANSLSSVRTGRTNTQLGPNPGSQADAYYYIVKMQGIQPSNSKLLQQAQAKLHANFYQVSVWL